MSIQLKTLVRVDKTFYVENTGAAEDDPSHAFDVDVTLTKLRVILRGTTPSITWTLRHAADRTAGGAVIHTATSTATTTQQVITSFSGDTTIPAGNIIWLETSADGGTVISFRITLYGEEDS